MSKEWEPENIFDVFGSAYARRILVLTSVQPMSAEELADRCDTSLPTVYRRVNALLEYDLVEEDLHVDESGNHYKTFESNLERICFEIADGGVNIDIQLRRDMVDRFGNFWGDLERASSDTNDDQ